MSEPSAHHYPGGELELFKRATRWKAYWSSRIRPRVKGDVLEVGAGIGSGDQDDGDDHQQQQGKTRTNERHPTSSLAPSLALLRSSARARAKGLERHVALPGAGPRYRWRLSMYCTTPSGTR